MVHTVHICMTIICVYGGASKDTALCVGLCGQLCVYHVFCACVHASMHMCTYCVYSLDLGTGNHNGLVPIGLEKEEAARVLRTPDTVLHCRCFEVFSVVDNFHLNCANMCFESFSIHKNSFAFDLRSIPLVPHTHTDHEKTAFRVEVHLALLG